MTSTEVAEKAAVAATLKPAVTAHILSRLSLNRDRVLIETALQHHHPRYWMRLKPFIC